MDETIDPLIRGLWRLSRNEAEAVDAARTRAQLDSHDWPEELVAALRQAVGGAIAQSFVSIADLTHPDEAWRSDMAEKLNRRSAEAARSTIRQFCVEKQNALITQACTAINDRYSFAVTFDRLAQAAQLTNAANGIAVSRLKGAWDRLNSVLQPIANTKVEDSTWRVASIFEAGRLAAALCAPAIEEALMALQLEPLSQPTVEALKARYTERAHDEIARVAQVNRAAIERAVSGHIMALFDTVRLELDSIIDAVRA